MESIKGPASLTFNFEKDSFLDGVSFLDIARYLKGVYTNKERMKANFVDYFTKYAKMCGRADKVELIETLLFYYDNVEPFSYAEAFELKNTTFRTLVFGSINISEMMQNLGSERVSVEGRKVNHRFYKTDGSYEMREYDVIYELYKVDCTKLNNRNRGDSLNMLRDNNYAYAVKCWCTTTNNEHWLWVETEYALKGPLEAIASTVRVYKNMIPHIKTIKRQGDVFLFEMDKEIKPSGEIIPLTAEQYFTKLVAQS